MSRLKLNASLCSTALFAIKRRWMPRFPQ
jgi:hypothetical protein